MAYLIDADWMIDHLAATAEATSLIAELAPSGIAISIITYLEVYQGIARSPTPLHARMGFAAFLSIAPVLDLTIPVAERCARLRETLRRQGKRVNNRALDLIVAATALEHDLTLVTRNVTDYRDIPGLDLYRA